MARILIIDDNDIFRKVLRTMLTTAGFNEIEEAANGIDGINLFRQSPFDLVITDIIMPEKEGLELITELSRDYPQVKIIAMSGGGRIGPHDYLAMAEYLGASRALQKPFKHEELIAVVQELLKK
jgi:YesN/AraC family two-component response regulator